MTFRFCDIKKKYFEGNKYFFSDNYIIHIRAHCGQEKEIFNIKIHIKYTLQTLFFKGVNFK